jgi:competence protein ComEC
VGLVLAATPPRHDLFVDREGAGAAIRGPAGKLVVVGKPSAFVVEQWLRADGDGRSVDDTALRDGARCDAAGCVVTSGRGLPVSYVTELRALEEDCRRAAVVITPLQAYACRATLVLDRVALQAGGATAVRFDEAGMAVRSARGVGELRLWSDRAAQPATAATPTRNRPRPARPTIDLPDPDEDVSSDEPS